MCCHVRFSNKSGRGFSPAHSYSYSDSLTGKLSLTFSLYKHLPKFLICRNRWDRQHSLPRLLSLELSLEFAFVVLASHVISLFSTRFQTVETVVNPGSRISCLKIVQLTFKPRLKRTSVGRMIQALWNNIKVDNSTWALANKRTKTGAEGRSTTVEIKRQSAHGCPWLKHWDFVAVNWYHFFFFFFYYNPNRA